MTRNEGDYCWWRHSWPKWEDAAQGDITHRMDGEEKGRIIGHWVRQERRCARCNQLEMRMVKALPVPGYD